MNLIKRITDRLRRKPLLVKPFVRRSLITVPEKEVIECEIETPQFHGSQDKFHLHRQCGTFYKAQMKFYPFVSMFGLYTGGDHKVCFSDINDFQSALVRLL
jgi:hypothetical protein